MRRRLVTIALIALVVGGLVGVALFTELGVFLVGYQFWMARAEAATTAAEMDASLVRVLGATQYGVNQAENFVVTVRDRDARLRLWNRLIVLAPNENWRRLYGYRLEAEYGKGPHAARKSR